jgi:hypothetical protein
MADIAAFPDMGDNILIAGTNIQRYKAGAAIKKGQAVAIHGTGVNETVHPAVKGTTASVEGVALADAEQGEYVPVAGPGCVVLMANADDTTGIDAGSGVEDNDNSVGGTISALPANSGSAIAAYANLVGVAIDDIPGDGIGRVRLLCSITCIPNNA